MTGAAIAESDCVDPHNISSGRDMRTVVAPAVLAGRHQAAASAWSPMGPPLWLGPRSLIGRLEPGAECRGTGRGPRTSPGAPWALRPLSRSENDRDEQEQDSQQSHDDQRSIHNAHPFQPLSSDGLPDEVAASTCCETVRSGRQSLGVGAAPMETVYGDSDLRGAAWLVWRRLRGHVETVQGH